MGIREKLINYQNKAEENFNQRKDAINMIRYIIALFIFISSTFVAFFTIPFRFVIKILSRQKSKANIVNANNKNIDDVIKNNKLVLIDFWATWCGPCVMMSSVLEEFAMHSQDICIAKVNADLNKKIIDDFNIRGLPQFVLLKNGKEIKRHAGPMSKSDLNYFCFGNQ